jgi:hypothetical protein
LALISSKNKNIIKELERENTNCLECGNPVKSYKAEYCCNGIDCGCRGLPIEPPICSDECWEKFNNK